MKRVPKLLLALTFLSTASFAADKVKQPDAVQLLDAAYAGPTFSYQGRVLLTQWTGKQTRSEEVNVFYAPPGHYRLEYLAPDGSVDRIVLGDGTREQVQVIKGGKVAAGYATEVSPRFIGKEDERRLLLENYKITLGGTEDIMGRTAWVLDLTPITAGKPQQRMWIDRQSNAILEVKRTLPDGGASSQFTRFEAKAVSEQQFGLDTSLVITDVEQAASTPEEALRLAGASGDRASLSGGFTLTGADLFDVKGEKVRHLRYTDGLIPVSLFVTRVAVDAPKVSDASNRPTSSPYLGLSTPVNVSRWKEGKEHFTLIGEVEPALLKEISAGSQPN